MPFAPKDATAHTKKAKSPKAKKQFAAVANAVLKKTGNEGKAVKVANAAVKKAVAKKKTPKPTMLSSAKFQDE